MYRDILIRDFIAFKLFAMMDLDKLICIKIELGEVYDKTDRKQDKSFY